MSEERDREREDEDAPSPRAGASARGRQSPRSARPGGGGRGRPGGRHVEEEDFYVQSPLGAPRGASRTFVEAAVNRASYEAPAPRGLGASAAAAPTGHVNLGALLASVLPTARAGRHAPLGPPAAELTALLARLLAAYEPPVRPADPSFVAALPRAGITPTLAERQEACTVCLDEYDVGEQGVVALPCGHLFHERCVSGWLLTDHRCPVCRSPLPEAGCVPRPPPARAERSVGEGEGEGVDVDTVLRRARLQDIDPVRELLLQLTRGGRMGIDEEGFDDVEMAAAVVESNAVERLEHDMRYEAQVDPLDFAVYDSLAGLTTVELREECDAEGLVVGGATRTDCLDALCERHGLTPRTVWRIEARRAADARGEQPVPGTRSLY